jgi:hypothetical protein
VSRIVAKSLLLLVAMLGVMSGASAETGVGAVISQDEVKIIVEWYRDHDATPYAGGGKKKAQGLPPGSQRKTSPMDCFVSCLQRRQATSASLSMARCCSSK